MEQNSDMKVRKLWGWTRHGGALWWSGTEAMRSREKERKAGEPFDPDHVCIRRLCGRVEECREESKITVWRRLDVAVQQTLIHNAKL